MDGVLRVVLPHGRTRLGVRSRPMSRRTEWPRPRTLRAARRKNESADKPDFVALARARRRPSIWAHRRRVPRAIHPRTRASSPRSCAQPHRLVRPSILLRAGFTEPLRSPAALVRSYRTVSPSPPSTRAAAVYFLWHCPAGRPGLPLATALLFGVRTFLDAGLPATAGGSARRGRLADSFCANSRGSAHRSAQ